MNRRLISVILFGIVIAGGASMVLYHLMMNRVVAGSTPTLATSQIVVAARIIDPGELIKDSDLRIAAWPGRVPPGSLTKMSDVVARGVAATIYEGEPIAEARLAPVGSGGGLAAMIPPGMRAVAVHVNDVVGVAGFVVAGTHVDVLASGSRPGRGDRPTDTVTRTVLQNITVLSAGQDYKQNADGKPATVQVVNLLVTSPQAETLSLAATQTTVQLVLRNSLDKQIVETSGTELATILGSPVAPISRIGPRHPVVQPAPVAAPVLTGDDEPLVMEIILGNKRTEAGLQATGETK
jgi:pilus assembly protein CpaB